MPMSWDKKLTQKLTAIGIPWEKAREVIGLIAEERQLADNEGYKRGFEDGFVAAERKTDLAPAPLMVDSCDGT